MAEITYDSRPSTWTSHVREIIDYRACLYWLVYREVRTRYRNAVLGLLWAVVQPLVTVLLVAGFFQKVAGVDVQEGSYSIFSACGIVPWLYFSKSIAASSQSFLSFRDIVKKTFFPRWYVPMTFVLSHGIDLLIGLVALAVWVAISGFIPGPVEVLSILFATVWLVVLVAALSLILSPLQVRFRDIGYATTYVFQGLFFASPILYSADRIDGVWKAFLLVNPLTGIFELYRRGFMGLAVEEVAQISGVLVTALLFAAGVLVFMRVEPNVSDKL